MRVLHCVAVLFVLFAARASFAQENCSTVLVADGVDFSMLKGGAVGSDLEPLNLDEDGDGIPDRPNEPSPDENGAPTLEWTLEDFDASDWEVAPSGFGYGDRLDIIGTVLDDMEESYVSVYLRHTFEIENLAGINSMAFNMDYDDSFVAYINGVEVARRNLEGSPPPSMNWPGPTTNRQAPSNPSRCSTLTLSKKVKISWRSRYTTPPGAAATYTSESR